MEARSNNRPDYRRLVFILNEKRPGIYDLCGPAFKKFNYFRLETPKAPYLIQQGARYVLQSWKQGKKALHTGLIETHRSGLYFGDHRDTTGKQSTMIVKITNNLHKIVILYFNHYSVYKGRRKQFVELCAGLFEKETGDKLPPVDVQTNRHSIGNVLPKIQQK